MWQIPRRDTSIFFLEERWKLHRSFLLSRYKRYCFQHHFTAFSGETLSQKCPLIPKFSTAVELGRREKKRRNGRGGKWHPKIQLHVFYYILLLLYSTRWSQDLDCSRRQRQQQQQKRGQKDIKKKMHALAARAHVLAAEACSRQINIRIVQQIRYQWSSLAEDSFDSSWLLRGFFFSSVDYAFKAKNKRRFSIWPLLP